MRDDGQGLDSDVGEPWATNGGARLQFAGIAKSDALMRANLNVSDEPDTSMPSHADIEPLGHPKGSRCPVASSVDEHKSLQRIEAVARIDHIRHAISILNEISSPLWYRAGISRPVG